MPTDIVGTITPELARLRKRLTVITDDENQWPYHVRLAACQAVQRSSPHIGLLRESTPEQLLDQVLPPFAERMHPPTPYRRAVMRQVNRPPTCLADVWPLYIRRPDSF